jgi:hypothetical protein
MSFFWYVRRGPIGHFSKPALLALSALVLSPDAGAGESACSSAATAAAGCMAYEHRDWDERPTGTDRTRSSVGNNNAIPEHSTGHIILTRVACLRSSCS